MLQRRDHGDSAPTQAGAGRVARLRGPRRRGAGHGRPGGRGTAARPATAVDCTGHTTRDTTSDPTRNTTSDRLPELDPQALRQALSSAPDRVTGVLARVSGPDGHWTGTYGAADITTGAPVPVAGRFRLGSVTKTFIATVMLQLAAEHRVDLDQPVQHYLPDVLPDSYPPIPVRTLLNFTSGLPELSQDDLPTTPDGIVAHRFDDHPLAELVAKAVRHERPFTEPGCMQAYGATGYYVAAMLVEHLTGHTYQQEITTRILQPLHLRDTTAPQTDTTIPGPHSHGYIAVPRPDGGSQLVDITEQAPGAGGMIATTADLDRFLTALFRGQLLPPTEQAELFDVPDVPYLGSTDHDPGQGRAYYAAGLMRVTLPNGVTVWGEDRHHLRLHQRHVHHPRPAPPPGVLLQPHHRRRQRPRPGHPDPVRGLRPLSVAPHG